MIIRVLRPFGAGRQMKPLSHYGGLDPMRPERYDGLRNALISDPDAGVYTLACSEPLDAVS